MRRLFYSLLGISALLLAGCSNELDDALKTESPSVATLKAVIPAYTVDDVSTTRVTLSEDLEALTWSAGDKIGLYFSGPTEEASAAFTLREGGSSVGTFTNEGFTLNSNETYYVFYPYVYNATTELASLAYHTQTQTGNNTTAHIAANNYMLASITTDGSGTPSTVNFENQSALMQFRFTPGAGTYTSLSVQSSSSKFRIKARLNMKTGTQSGGTSSYTQTLTLKDVTIANGELLVANMLAAPINHSATTYTITLTKSNGSTVVYTEAGKNMKAGRIYKFGEAVAAEYAKLTSGTTFNRIIKTLAAGTAVDYTAADANITQIKFEVNSSATSSTEVQSGDSDAPIYASYSGGTLTISTSAPKIRLDANAAYLFSYLKNLTTITGLENLDTSRVENMSFMFNYCNSLTTLNLSTFNTANVTSMRRMFYNCNMMNTLNVSSFDTSSVTNFNEMFNRCSRMTTLTMGETFLVGGSATVNDMCYNLANTSKACTITCMTAAKTSMLASSNFPTVPTFTWVLLDGGGSYEAGGEGYPWG